MNFSIWKVVHRAAPVIAVAALVAAMGGNWQVAPAIAAPTATVSAVDPAAKAGTGGAAHGGRRPFKKDVAGKLNLNTATEEQLMMLPTIGPSKAERIVAWRKKNGGFKRTADLRRVKGFGYKTFKRLEPFLEVRGDSTLAPK